MTENLTFIRPSAYADRAELFYIDLSGRTLSMLTRDVDRDHLLSPRDEEYLLAVRDFGNGRYFIAEIKSRGSDSLHAYRSRLIAKEKVLQDFGITLTVVCDIFIHLFEKNGDKVEPIALHPLEPIIDEKIERFVHILLGELDKIGIEVELSYLFERGIALRAKGTACDICDYITMIRVIAKRVARGLGLDLTFMPKPIFPESGRGVTITLELSGDKSESFSEGVILHSPETLCMTNQSANSFLRLKDFSGYLCYGADSLFCLKKEPKRLKLSFDYGDLSGNPYIFFSALIQAGIMGVEGGLTLREETVELTPSLQRVTPRLPFDPIEALRISESSGFLSKTLGESLAGRFFTEKTEEYAFFAKEVSESEHRARYFDKF